MNNNISPIEIMEICINFNKLKEDIKKIILNSLQIDYVDSIYEIKFKIFK